MASSMYRLQPQPQLERLRRGQSPSAAPSPAQLQPYNRRYNTLSNAWCSVDRLALPASTGIPPQQHQQRFHHLLPHAAKKGFGSSSTSTKQGSASGAKTPSTCPCGSGKPYQVRKQLRKDEQPVGKVPHRCWEFISRGAQSTGHR